MWIRATLVGLALLVGPVSAQQSETLADIKQDMSVLFVELQRLKQELNTTGASATQVSGSMLDRVTVIEAELQRITAKTEELSFRIGRVVEDGTNRLGDLDFRVCELEPGCDIGALGRTSRLGGDAVPEAQAAAPAPQATDALPAGRGELAVSEEADYRTAQAAFEAGDHSGAMSLFQLFRETYPQSPLEAAAFVGEGRAAEALGDTREAARLFLASYSNYPDATVAPEALWRLGVALAGLGASSEACVTLSEVAGRYPGSAFVAQAEASKSELGCS